MKAVVVKNLSYRYQSEGAEVLKNLAFEIVQGEIVVLMGLSGCGKSTLAYCLSGIIPHCWSGIMDGEVLINGKNTREFGVARLALEVGMVFQNPDTQLFSPTVEDEIAFAPENMCLPPVRIRERVDYVLDLLGIGALRDANPYQLSGGEKHLVALAAVLALDPPVLVLDEVMSQLDQVGKKNVADALEKLRQQGKTIITVEHDLETVNFADRIMVMEGGELIRYDRKEILLADRDFLAACRLV
ncbi:MAG: ABC transporter ATP-binding protein [Syntrophomonas sp.]|nr:ABC transporter ATP-binding protein [Syntrophomonas sp.]